MVASSPGWAVIYVQHGDFYINSCIVTDVYWCQVLYSCANVNHLNVVIHVPSNSTSAYMQMTWQRSDPPNLKASGLILLSLWDKLQVSQFPSCCFCQQCLVFSQAEAVSLCWLAVLLHTLCLLNTLEASPEWLVISLIMCTCAHCKQTHCWCHHWFGEGNG